MGDEDVGYDDGLHIFWTDQKPPAQSVRCKRTVKAQSPPGAKNSQLYLCPCSSVESDFGFESHGITLDLLTSSSSEQSDDLSANRLSAGLLEGLLVLSSEMTHLPCHLLNESYLSRP